MDALPRTPGSEKVPKNKIVEIPCTDGLVTCMPFISTGWVVKEFIELGVHVNKQDYVNARTAWLSYDEVRVLRDHLTTLLEKHDGCDR